jgi:uncharacterized membrane protein HdeD (DUF308 family)
MDQERPAQQEPSRRQKLEYDVASEIFIGSMVLIMGALIFITLLVTDMPEEHPWNPVVMNVLTGSIYLVIGGFVLYRARRRAKFLEQRPQ